MVDPARRTCKSCKGTGKSYFGDHPCYTCHGRIEIEQPDWLSIIQEIKGRKGLRSSRPKSTRAYFVWRMARFHGGVDVCMPVCAGMEIHGDPWEPELEKFSEIIARKVFGTDMAAASRWGRALGYNVPDLPNLPATAYEDGPVVAAKKPECELGELL